MAQLDLQIHHGVATLTMNNPAARNALTAEMKDGFAQAAERLQHDPEVRAVVLAGAGGCFCAGGDLRGMLEARPTATVESWRERMASLHPWVRTLLELEKPIVAAVDGAAYGAGFSIALVADFVLVSPRARFCMSFMRVGLVPDCAAMYTLPRVVGVQRAKELMLSAREVGPDEALRLGLAMEQVPSAHLLARAQQLAASFTGASALAAGLIKREVGQALQADLRTALTHEADHQALCFQSSYHQQAVQNFLDKQPAMFQFPQAPQA